MGEPTSEFRSIQSQIVAQHVEQGVSGSTDEMLRVAPFTRKVKSAMISSRRLSFVKQLEAAPPLYRAHAAAIPTLTRSEINDDADSAIAQLR